MDRFIHASVRLNTDLGRVTRLFSQPSHMTRWLCGQAEVIQGGSVIKLKDLNEPGDHWEWHIDEIVREKLISARCSDFLHQDENNLFPLEIQLMKCTSLTEYCSEIHVIQRGFDISEAGDALRSDYLDFWKAKLENLRSLINGKWIIEDRDLSLDIFK